MLRNIPDHLQAIYKSVENDDLNALQTLLAKENIKKDINFNHKIHGTPLIFSINKNSFSHVQALLNAKADVNISYKENSPLIWATKSQNISNVQILLEAKANINFQGKQNDTALSWAAYLGKTRSIELLLRAKADPNIPSDERLTPLMWAIKSLHQKNKNPTKALIHNARILDESLDLEFKDENGFTALDRALQLQSRSYYALPHIKALLKAKAIIHNFNELYEGFKKIDARNTLLFTILTQTLAQHNTLSQTLTDNSGPKSSIKLLTPEQYTVLHRKLEINNLHFENMQLLIEIATKIPRSLCQLIIGFYFTEEIIFPIDDEKNIYPVKKALNKTLHTEFRATFFSAKQSAPKRKNTEQDLLHAEPARRKLNNTIK